jgi:hypothetical protein
MSYQYVSVALKATQGHNENIHKLLMIDTTLEKYIEVMPVL